MTNSVTEVELRGLLPGNSHLELESFLTQNGTLKQEKNRVLIDYSTFLPDGGIQDRSRDVRIRNTNGNSEIIIKMGSWGGSESRTEHAVHTQDGFDQLAEVMHLLGYDKGILCVRRTKVFEYKNIEIAIVEVPNHSYYFEAEVELPADANQDDINQAHTKIESIVAELGLKLLSDNDFFAYIETLNKEANTVYSHMDESKTFFQDNFSI